MVPEAVAIAVEGTRELLHEEYDVPMVQSELRPPILTCSKQGHCMSTQERSLNRPPEQPPHLEQFYLESSARCVE